MSARLQLSLALIGLCALPAITVPALADPYLFPELQARPQPKVRPGYRHTAFPPPQHNFLGLAARPTGIAPRPGYRAAEEQFPPAGGRYGGDFIEYVLTGGRPEPLDPRYPNAMPQITPLRSPEPAPGPVVAPNPNRAALPKSGLPDFIPELQATYTAPPAAPQQVAQQQVAAYDPNAVSTPVDLAPATNAAAMNPDYQRQLVAYPGKHRPGTVVIDTPNKFLYLVQPGGQALRYGIGVGRPGFTWAGIKKISRKAEWPAWTPPSQMLKRRPDLPRHMVGGEANPLGARAMYLGSSMYRIHGTNEPSTIGMNVSSGCIRMMNQDVIDLYGRVRVGTRVVVM